MLKLFRGSPTAVASSSCRLQARHPIPKNPACPRRAPGTGRLKRRQTPICPALTGNFATLSPSIPRKMSQRRYNTLETNLHENLLRPPPPKHWPVRPGSANLPPRQNPSSGCGRSRTCACACQSARQNHNRRAEALLAAPSRRNGPAVTEIVRAWLPGSAVWQ